MAGKTKPRSLSTYNQKRDFQKTAEPKGERPGKAGCSYLIQKHAASRLHYDFRLEHAGVLLSWSVPKGPSVDPSDKRLAVRTEDHPVAYGDFEGTIPKGEYGGGTVMLWDRGQWEPHGDVSEGLDKGELKFTLKGERLTGGWALVRMNVERGRENWLLIKEKDAAASARDNPVKTHQTSVKTGRGMKEIAEGDSAVWHSGRASKDEGKGGGKAGSNTDRKRTVSRPGFTEPQLATLVDAAPEGEEWLHEIKFDGYRVICGIGKGATKIWTRSGKDWTEKFAALVPSLEGLDAEAALIDGEVCVVDDQGRTDFKRLQNALRAGAKEELTMFAFDLLSLDGKSLAARPLTERKEKLRALFGKAKTRGHVRYSDHVVGAGPAFYDEACKQGLEGIISKKANAKYVSARSKTWLKSKCVRRQEFVVAGYAKSEKNPRGIASLLLGVWDGEDLCYAGRVGTGFTAAERREWKTRLDAATADNPYADIPDSDARGAVFARPERVVEVEFTEWTSEGRLRHPALVAERSDKPAEDIVKESAQDAASVRPAGKPASGKGGAGTSRRQGKGDETEELAGVRLTHPDRVLYPDQGVTKQALAEYYLEVADRILPYLKDRPVSIVRCPQGRQKQCFFQRHVHKGSPKELGSVTVPEREGTGDYLLVDDAAALVAAVQIGALELHPWGARKDDFERPDMMIFDLDPDEGLDFGDVKQAARDVRGVLEAVGLDSFLKTTGGKGLHVVAPLTRRREWPEVKAFARALAERLSDAEPKRYVANMSKAKRKDRIFVDYLRNDRMNTAVAPYSTRARAGATISVPLRWDELDRLKTPAAYDVGNIRRRLSALKADPWEDFFSVRQSITKSAMEALGVEV